MSSDVLLSPTPFLFEGRVFVCAAVRTDQGSYKPVVMTGGPHGVTRLPVDAEGCGSQTEALRSAEQFAVRWTREQVHDKQGAE